MTGKSNFLDFLWSLWWFIWLNDKTNSLDSRGLARASVGKAGLRNGRLSSYVERYIAWWSTEKKTRPSWFRMQAPSHVLNELGSSQAQLSPQAATSCHYRKSNISILKWKTEMTICFYWGCNHPFCSPYDSMLKANEENLFYSFGFDQSVLRKIIIQQAPLFKMKYIGVINVSSRNSTKKRTIKKLYWQNGLFYETGAFFSLIKWI